LGDSFGVRRDDIQIMLLRLGLKAGRLIALRIKQSPTQRNLLITPALCKVGTHAQNNVEMVAHHGIAADVDTEDGRELLEPQANPFFAVIVVFSGDRILAAEERPPYASNDAVVEADAVIGHDLVAGEGRHEQELASRAVSDTAHTMIIVSVMDKSIKGMPPVKTLPSRLHPE
jgi:hypothetical protein